MTELFKASKALREQGQIIGELEPLIVMNSELKKLYRIKELGSDAMNHLIAGANEYNANGKNNEPWAAKLIADATPVDPDPVPPDPDGDVLVYAVAAPYKPNGRYGWLNQLTNADLRGAELGVGGRSRWITSNDSGQESPVPASESNIRVVYNSELKDGERGALWHNRAYNVSGVYRNATVYRAGDHFKGKEGHGWYDNVYRNVSWIDCHAIQCGGNPWQLVHRDKETRLVGTDHDAIRSASTVMLTDCSATDSGYIDESDESSARGSWPLSFFNPGHSLITYRFRVETEIDPFNWSGGVGRSHGAVLNGVGQDFRRCPMARHYEPYVDVVDSDRELFHVDAVDDFRLEGATMKNTSGTPDVMITTRCKTAVVYKPKTDLRVVVKDGPYGKQVDSKIVRAGTVWEL